MQKVLYILGELSNSDIEWMAQTGRRRELARGDVIVQQGTQADDLFIVLAGAVEIVVSDVGVVDRLGAGEIIGEMSFVDRAPPSATVRAAEPATVFALSKRKMAANLMADVGFSARFYKALAVYLSDRLREATRRGSGAPVDENRDKIVADPSFAGTRFNELLEKLKAAPQA